MLRILQRKMEGADFFNRLMSDSVALNREHYEQDATPHHWRSL